MAAKDPRSPSDPSVGQGGPARADWRRAAPRAAVPPAAGKKAGGAWRVKPDQTYEDARRWYRIRLASWVLFAVALSIAFIAAIIYWPRRTPFVAMAVTDYEGQASLAVPPNGWAKEDVDRFRDLDEREEIIKYSNAAYIPERPDKSAFDGLREEIRKQSTWRNFGYPIIVYLSVHGVVNRDGKPCLLLPGASPLASDKWLPLESLVTYLFPPDAQKTLPRKKLLILDCNRMDANWRLGLLYNSFADGLQEVLQDVAQRTPGLAILNSTGPGQIGWTSPEQLHGSVFAYFVWQGLRGAADRADEGGNGNGDVSLGELHRYVAKKVEQWVREHRADIQEPQLFTEENADKFFLVHAKRGPPTEIPPPSADFRNRWATDIDPLWAKHEELSKASPWRINPLGWERFQQGLLRLEQLAVAGPSYQDEYGRLKDALNAQADSLTNQDLPPDLSAASIPLRMEIASGAERKKVADEEKALRARWNQAQQRFAPEAPREASCLAAADEAWRRCLDGVDMARWPDLLQFVDAPSRRGRSAGEVVEMHFLRMLDAYLDPLTWKNHAAVVKRALVARDLAEKAAAPGDERVHYWIQSAVDKADHARRQAEDRLFVGSPNAVQEAEQALASLTSPVGNALRGVPGIATGTGVPGMATDGGVPGIATGAASPPPGTPRRAFPTEAYPGAIRDADQVASAFALRDRAWAEIPYYAQWILARGRRENERQKQLLDSLIKSAHALGAELDRAILDHETAKQGWSPAWEGSYRAAQSSLKQLQNDFQAECARLWGVAAADRETLRATSVVLSVPLVSGKQRSDLWANYWEIIGGKRSGEGPNPAARREEKAGPEAAPGQSKGEDFRVAGLPGQEATDAYLKRLPTIHPALKILDRSALGDQPQCLKTAFEAALGRGTPGDEDAARRRALARLAQQGQCVRDLLAAPGNDSVGASGDAWLKQSKARLEAGDRSLAEIREGRAKADRLVRAAAGLMDLARSPWDKPEDDPPHRLRRLDLFDLFAWHAYRTLEDFWGPPRPDTPSFFITATEGYLASCGKLCPAIKYPRYQSPDLKEAVNLPDRLKARKAAVAAAVVLKADDLSIRKADAASPTAPAATTPGEVVTRIGANLPEGTAALYLRGRAWGNPPDPTIPMQVQAGDVRNDVRRTAIAVRSGGLVPPQKYSVWSNDPHLDAPRLKAVALYRGHEYTADFTATPPDYEVVYQRPDYPKPHVAVFGQALQGPCPVAFILDCSGSMEAVTTVVREARTKPGQKGPAVGRQTTRFAVARAALEQILDRLAQSEMPFDVGLIAYGHRVGWQWDATQKKDVPVIWDPKNPGQTMPKPEDDPLTPGTDVQVLRSPSQFGPVQLEDLKRKIDGLHPLGVTPLYRSIKVALAELAGEQPSKDAHRAAPRHIVVITDGIDEGDDQVLKSDLSKLFGKPENRDVTLDVVGFSLTDWDLLWECVNHQVDGQAKYGAVLKSLKQQGVEASAAAADPRIDQSALLKKFQDKRLELQELAAETAHPEAAPRPGATTKGFYPVDEAYGISQVVEALQQSLALRIAKYVIERVGDSKPVASEELNRTVTLDKPAVSQRYVVRVGQGERQVSAALTLEGGEDERLYLSKDGTRLEHRRYATNLNPWSAAVDLRDPSDPENPAKRFFVGAHIPDWNRRAVQFPISIQNNDPAKFSPRPQEAWIQVQPLAPGSAAAPPPYVVYDLTYQAERPVPVLLVTAPDWPDKAEEAEIRLWFKLQKTPAEAITVDELRKRGQYELDGLPGTVFTIEDRPGEHGSSCQIVITERHPADQPIEGARVEMAPAPDRVTREYNRKAGTVHHAFWYSAADPAQVGNFRVLITPFSRLSQRAVKLATPLKVGIARRSR